MSVKIYVDGREVLLTSPQDIAAFEAARPLLTLAKAKADADARITVARNAALSSLTATWGGDTWDADEATSARIANALSMVREAAAIGIPTPPSIPWRTADNKDRTLTIAELTQMGAAVFQAQQVMWAKQAQLKNAIDAATTIEAVQAVQW
jgi:hypothetical protein